MPIIMGALAANSSVKASGLVQLSAERRKAEYNSIRHLQGSGWRSFPQADGVVMDERGVRLEGETSPRAGPSPISSNGQESTDMVKKPCWCGLISDEVAARDAVDQFFEEPESSHAASAVSFILMLLIIMSTITIVLESLPSMDNDVARADFFVVESLCITFFTIEYVVRILAADQKGNFVVAPMNVIDLVAIAPFYIGLALAIFGLSADDVSFLKLLRLFRIFRIFKLFKYSSGIKVCAAAIIESKDTLGLMIFMCSVVVIIFGSFEFFFEGGVWNKADLQYQYEDGTPTPFFSIPAAMWWTMVTIMTVGYGDIAPTTTLGKLTASFAMLCSIVIMALPISVIGANFSRAWMEKKEEESGDSDIPDNNKLLTALIQHNALIEEVLVSSSGSLVSLQKELAKAQYEYLKLAPQAKQQQHCSAYDLNGPGSERLKGLVDSIFKREEDLQQSMRKLIPCTESGLKEKAEKQLVTNSNLEAAILRYQEISANIIGLEQVLFGNSLQVVGR